MKKLVIFDMDGTLLDSVPDILESINKMLAYFGYPPVDKERILSAIGQGGEAFVRAMLPEGHEEEVPVCRPVYNEIYRDSGSPKTALFRGIRAALLRLKEAGVRLAILSNKPHKNTLAIYNVKLGSFRFDMVFGNREGVPAKPDASAVFEILKALGVAPEDAALVGDGETDMLAAKNSGIDGIAVSWGYRSPEFLMRNGAKYVVSTPREMVDLVLSL